VKTDGIFGDDTETAVRELQTMFGYDVDGIVGPGTSKLIEQQIGYGWNKNAPDAFQKAQKAQGKGDAGGKMQDGGKMAQGGQAGGADKFGKNPQQQQQPQGKGGMMPPEKQMGGAQHQQKGGAPPGKPQQSPKK
jgi:hypothetical protein